MPDAPAIQNIIAPYDPTGQPRFMVLFLHPNGKHWDTIFAMRDHVHVQEDNGRFLFSFWPNWMDFQFLRSCPGCHSGGRRAVGRR